MQEDGELAVGNDRLVGRRGKEECINTRQLTSTTLPAAVTGPIEVLRVMVMAEDGLVCRDWADADLAMGLTDTSYWLCADDGRALLAELAVGWSS
jgi:hypothetical protein